jgi:hypothetical protein
MVRRLRSTMLCSILLRLLTRCVTAKEVSLSDRIYNDQNKISIKSSDCASCVLRSNLLLWD